MTVKRERPKARQQAEEKSWESFCAALEEGETAFDGARKKLALRDADYQMIDVGTARQKGIMPIAYRK